MSKEMREQMNKFKNLLKEDTSKESMTREGIIDYAMKHADDVIKTYREENRTMQQGDIRVLTNVIANIVLEKTLNNLSEKSYEKLKGFFDMAIDGFNYHFITQKYETKEELEEKLIWFSDWLKRLDDKF